MKRIALLVLSMTTVFMTLVLGIPEAQANCATFGYFVETDPANNTVTICVDDQGDGTMLRHNVDTGEVVQLPRAQHNLYADSCYSDECVPAGTYHYGNIEPLPCGCGIQENYTEVVVESELAQDCVPEDPEDVPTVYAAGIPWGDAQSESCTSSGCSVAEQPNGYVFPTFAGVALVGLLMILRRRFSRQ